MKEQRIVIEIHHDGQITADAEGFSGDACLRDLEKLLDGLVEWDSMQRKTDGGDRTVTRARTNHVTGGHTP
jgi:hypothetical protein